MSDAEYITLVKQSTHIVQFHLYQEHPHLQLDCYQGSALMVMVVECVCGEGTKSCQVIRHV